MKVGEIHTEENAIKEIARLEKAMWLQFEEAAVLRDKIRGEGRVVWCEVS